MSIDGEVFADLVGLLYEGIACPDRWNDFLAQLCRQTGCGHASLTFHDAGNRYPAVGFSIGLSQDALVEWHTYYGARNPRAPEIWRWLLRSGWWLSSTSLEETPAAYRNTEYGDWMQRYDLSHSILAAARIGQGATSVNLIRGRIGKPFGQDALELMGRLLPHIQRAIRIHSQNETSRAFFEAGTSALNRLDTGVVALDESGRVLLMNERAKASLEKGQGIRVLEERLTATRASESARLEQVIRSAAIAGAGGGTGCTGGGAITIHGDDASIRFRILVTPFGSHRIFAGERPCALAFISDPAGKPASRAASLRDLFGLTPAECRLAGLLHEGLELRESAQKMRVTAATARFMLKRIFYKTGAHRQSQLIGLLSSLPGEAGR